MTDTPTERIPTPPADTPVSEPPTERIPTPPADTSAPEAPTERIPAVPAEEPPVSEAPTERISAMPAPVTPQAPGFPAHPVTSPPASGPVGSAPEAETARVPAMDPAQWPTLRPAPPPPSAPASRSRAALAWARARWRWLTLALALLVVVAAALSAYAYATSLAAQPQRIVTSYCAALTHADYKAAYALLAPSLQEQSTLAQYEADGAARDAISGRVTRCSATPAQRISALSFLGDPRSVIFNLALTRASGESGQIALSRDATGWHVAGLSSGVSGVDLGPLHTEQTLCQAFIGRKYDVAYGLLSAPYQREQGSEAAFARAFGANLAITGCAPALRGYTVDKADQRASFQVTLNVTVSGGGSATSLTLPAKMALVREPDGWRVDSITPLLGQ